MSWFTRLFHRQREPKPELLSLPRSVGPTKTEQDATRENMEARMAADREKRGETDKRP